MTPIAELKGIKPDEARLLKSNGVGTIEQLWICVANGESELDRLGDVMGSRSRLITLLTAEGLRESRTLGDSWIARRWLDLTLALVLILMTLLIIRARRA